MTTRQAGHLLGIPIGNKSLAVAIEDTIIAIEGTRPPVIFACANPHSLVVAQSDPIFQSALMQANLVVADGVGVTFMAQLVGAQVGPRITGTDYFQAVLKALQQRDGGRIFFFGSSQLVLDLIAKRFAIDYPALTLCGMLSPPFGSWSDEENRRMVQVINETKPDVLWVGMTAPKQEKWVEANRQQLNARVVGSIGAVFNFYAGTHARAPRWVCRMGFEWAYRFMLEPRRMWQRNIVSAPKFVWLVFKRHMLGNVGG
ncbi:MAG: WecB/TagA/CpsF family glycosyltransferase [Nitrospiraceae bacterium]|nr:WecB/TagA/CpsF family glycosyltransferase [Nitrospiraceae bacterium]